MAWLVAHACWVADATLCRLHIFGYPGLLLAAWSQLIVVCATLVLTTLVSCREPHMTEAKRSGQQSHQSAVFSVEVCRRMDSGANRLPPVMGDTFRSSDLIDTRYSRPYLPRRADV